MSRVGKNPVAVPQGVTVQLSDSQIKAKGKIGELAMTLNRQVIVKQEDGKIVVTPANESKSARLMWGTTRNRIQSMMTGVTEGFSKTLMIEGVGYRADLQGNKLVAKFGFSHELVFVVPPGLKVAVDKQVVIKITGADKELVGQFAANIRSKKKPEPYKGKGVRYDDEQVERKEGKKK